MLPGLVLHDKECSDLKQDLKTQLDLPWVVFLACDRSEHRRAYLRVGLREQWRIRQVKRFCSELNCSTFRGTEALEHREIDVTSIIRTNSRHGSSEIAEREWRGLHDLASVKPSIDGLLFSQARRNTGGGGRCVPPKQKQALLARLKLRSGNPCERVRIPFTCQLPKAAFTNRFQFAPTCLPRPKGSSYTAFVTNRCG